MCGYEGESRFGNTYIFCEWQITYVVMQGCYRDYWVLHIGFAIESSKVNKLTFPLAEKKLGIAKNFTEN